MSELWFSLSEEVRCIIGIIAFMAIWLLMCKVSDVIGIKIDERKNRKVVMKNEPTQLVHASVRQQADTIGNGRKNRCKPSDILQH